MLPTIPPGWSSLLGDEIDKPYYRSLDRFLDQQLAEGHSLLPPRDDIFTALRFTPYEEVKVLLLGQDPYPTPGYAHGLSFSVLPDVRPLPGSLRNIYKELNTDLGCRIPNNGYLEPWARQGVLLLNTILTLRASEANSHRARGWEEFTDRIIQLVAAKRTRVVFLLWAHPLRKKPRSFRSPITPSFSALIRRRCPLDYSSAAAVFPARISSSPRLVCLRLIGKYRMCELAMKRKAHRWRDALQSDASSLEIPGML